MAAKRLKNLDIAYCPDCAARVPTFRQMLAGVEGEYYGTIDLTSYTLNVLELLGIYRYDVPETARGVMLCPGCGTHQDATILECPNCEWATDKHGWRTVGEMLMGRENRECYNVNPSAYVRALVRLVLP